MVNVILAGKRELFVPSINAIQVRQQKASAHAAVRLQPGACPRPMTEKGLNRQISGNFVVSNQSLVEEHIRHHVTANGKRRSGPLQTTSKKKTSLGYLTHSTSLDKHSRNSPTVSKGSIRSAAISRVS